MDPEIHHIIHDIDRDGWGSAAMLLAQLGPARCRLHPTASKSGLAVLAGVDTQPGDHIWVLDIPTPKSWANAPKPDGVAITWVDHHPVRAAETHPNHVRLYLPRSRKRVTTMHLLVQHELVPNLNKPMEFVRTLCVPEFETRWTRAIDGLSETWLGNPVEPEELPEVLSRAVVDGPVPSGLAEIEHHLAMMHAHVDRILDDCKVTLRERIVVVHLASAEGIKLKYFNMRAQRRYERPVSILVHQKSKIYCGLASSGSPDFDIIDHFAGRGIEAKGLSFVAFASIKKDRIEQELEALITALEKIAP